MSLMIIIIINSLPTFGAKDHRTTPFSVIIHVSFLPLDISVNNEKKYFYNKLNIFKPSIDFFASYEKLLVIVFRPKKKT